MRQDAADSGHEFELKGRSGAARHGLRLPVHEGMIQRSASKLDPRGNVAADTISYKTSAEKIFACGDMRRGQSLVVWAIREGRQCARSVDSS
jgi:glutamate synthase (NADPH/NADH) small chain